jgi:hypothetical protein
LPRSVCWLAYHVAEKRATPKISRMYIAVHIPLLAGAQGGHGVDEGGAARREIAGKQGDGGQRQGHRRGAILPPRVPFHQREPHGPFFLEPFRPSVEGVLCLETLDSRLASGEPLGASAERVFQGPIADALTHVGQIAMLRRLAGCPQHGENYYEADIAVGRVGWEQAPAKVAF